MEKKVNILDTWINMNKEFNIAIVGLGQIGSYFYNELNTKKKDIELKTGKKIKIVAISAKNKIKKENLELTKKYSTEIL